MTNLQLHFRLLSVAALAVVLAGCSPEGQQAGAGAPVDTIPPLLRLPPEADSTASDTTKARPGVDLATILDRSSDHGPDGKLTVLRELNPPGHVEQEAITNRHVPGQVDTIRTLHYAGLSITVYMVSASGWELMQTIEVTGDAYRTEAGLGIGSTREEVQAVVGEPTSMEDVGSIYELHESPGGDPTPTILTVAYAGDRAKWMRWSFYVD